jgi:hypothetical protein
MAVYDMARIGIVQRLRAKSTFPSGRNSWIRSIRLLRALTDEDRKAISDWGKGRNYRTSADEETTQGAGDDDDASDLDDAEGEVDFELLETVREEDIVSHKPPVWDPGEVLYRQIFDVVQAAGSEGISSMVSVLNSHHRYIRCVLF